MATCSRCEIDEAEMRNLCVACVENMTKEEIDEYENNK